MLEEVGFLNAMGLAAGSKQPWRLEAVEVEYGTSLATSSFCNQTRGILPYMIMTRTFEGLRKGHGLPCKPRGG